MTNTLHRQGTHESLSKDYIIFLHTAKGINRDGAGEKMKQFLRLALEEGPVNIGGADLNRFTAGDPENMMGKINDGSTVSATFSDPEALRRFIRKLKKEDMGISVNISGLADEVNEILQSEGIVRHSIEHSLGVFGCTSRLPTRQVLELSTMCGHGMVSHNYARKMIDWVKMGKIKPCEAAKCLARPCVCGVFNVDRATELLEKAAKLG